jgi:hypothetical protein
VETHCPHVALLGSWQLDLGRTHYGPGVDRPRRERMRCDMRASLTNCTVESVRDLGGWKSSEVVVRCYVTADMDSMRQSLSSRGESAQDAEMDRVHSANTLNEKRA